MESANNRVIEPLPATPLQMLQETHSKDVPAPKDDPNNMDPKKLKRVMASRRYSQKYRMKQLKYILQLETEVKALQAEVAITNPRIKYVDRQNSLLRVENRCIRQRLSAYSSELMFKEAQYKELQKERDILKQVYMVNQQLPPELFKVPGPSHNNNFDPPTF